MIIYSLLCARHEGQRTVGMAPFILKLAVVAVHIAEIFSVAHRKENPSLNNGRCGYKLINDFRYITPNFRFSPCIIIVNHFYYPTNALNYTKLRD